MNGITLQNVVLPENCVKFYTSSPIDSGIETKIPISLMQYDSGMAIVAFTILEKNTIYKPPESVEINVRFEKPDGHGVYNPVLGTDENGVVYFQITTQMTVAYGSGTCCLELENAEGIKCTKKVPVYIAQNPVNNENIESTDEYKTIFEIYEEVKRIGAIVENNEEAIQEIHDNIDLIKQVPSLAQQTQENANQVTSDKQEVLTAKESVDSSLAQVLQSEQNAKQSEQNAKQSETLATKSAQQTQQDAQTTTSDREYVESVMSNIENADEYATQSKSWAIGGTGTRPDEDVNNAKYWAEQAASMVSGSLGYFDTPELLEQAHPTGKNGDWAIIGSTNSMWIWDAETSSFIDTLEGVDLSNFYNKEYIDNNYYTKSQSNNKYALKTSLDNYYTSSYITQNYYTKNFVDLNFASKNDLSSYCTTNYLTSNYYSQTDIKTINSYKYRATFYYNSWEGSSSYSQTVALSAIDGGPSVTSNSVFMSAAMYEQTSSQETNETLANVLEIINNGNLTLGNNQITSEVWEKPESDIEIILIIKQGSI